jgi:hypothetical protein
MLFAVNISNDTELRYRNIPIALIELYIAADLCFVNYQARCREKNVEMD